MHGGDRARLVVLCCALLLLGCAAPPRNESAGSGEQEPCRVSRAQVWAMSMHISPGPRLTSAETVKRLAGVRVDVNASEAAERLAANFDEIAVHPCLGDASFCDHLDAVVVAQFQGARGCQRLFIADRNTLVDVKGRRYGKIGEGFRSVFGLDVWRNCTARDAVALMMTKEVRTDMPPGAELSRLEQIERREVLGPMKWAEFRRAKPELAQEVEPDVPPVLNKRDFFYIRLGRAKANDTSRDEWTREAFVTQTGCTVLEVPRKR